MLSLIRTSAYLPSGLHLATKSRALTHPPPPTYDVRSRTHPQSFASTTLLLTRRLDLELCQTMQRGAIFFYKKNQL